MEFYKYVKEGNGKSTAKIKFHKKEGFRDRSKLKQKKVSASK